MYGHYHLKPPALRMLVAQHQVTNSSQVATEHILKGSEQAQHYRGRLAYPTAPVVYARNAQLCSHAHLPCLKGLQRWDQMG